MSPARKCFLVLIARCEAGSGLHPCPLQRAPSFLAACVNPCPHRHLLTHPFQIFSSASRRWRIPSKCRHTAKENICHSLTFSHHLSLAASRCSSPQWRQMTKQQIRRRALEEPRAHAPNHPSHGRRTEPAQGAKQQGLLQRTSSDLLVGGRASMSLRSTAGGIGLSSSVPFRSKVGMLRSAGGRESSVESVSTPTLGWGGLACSPGDDCRASRGCSLQPASTAELGSAGRLGTETASPSDSRFFLRWRCRLPRRFSTFSMLGRPSPTVARVPR